MFKLITTLPVENNPEIFYRVGVEFLEDSFSVIIVDKKTSYKGEVKSNYISEQSETLHIPKLDYIKECRKAFQDPQSSVFTYSIVDDYFHLKKNIATSSSNSIKVKFTSIKLEKVDFLESVISMFDTTLHSNKEYLKKIRDLESDNESLVEENKLLLDQLEILQKEKNEMEKSLYSRFLNLLNSKKKKIRELRQRIGEEVDDDTSDIEEEQMEIEIGDANDVYEVDTDVDEDVIAEPTTSTRPEEVKNLSKEEPSTSKPVSKEWNIKEYLESNKSSNCEPGSSNVQSIFDAMSFLDPTVPFVSQ